MRRIDFGRPYGEVLGDPDIRYEQDGLLFDHKGRHIPDSSDPDVVEPEIQSPEDEVDFRHLSIVQLKELMHVCGQPYTTKQAAILYLEGAR